jgi:lysophospholipase L1-like esterase
MVLLTHDALCDAYDAADRILREVSNEKGVPLIDASNVLSGKSEFFSDYVHLTERGSTALADVIPLGWRHF